MGLEHQEELVGHHLPGSRQVARRQLLVAQLAGLWGLGACDRCRRRYLACLVVVLGLSLSLVDQVDQA